VAEILRVLSFSDEYLDDIVRLYNLHMTHLPYAWPITAEDFRGAVMGMATPSGHELPFDAGGLKVAFRGDSAAGYAHAMELRGRKRSSAGRKGAICFLCIAPGDIEVAEALIAACSQYLGSKGLRCEEVWPLEYSYWFFQGGKGKISEESHIAETLVRCGWKPTGGEHVMVLDLGSPNGVVSPRIEVEVRKMEKQGRYRDWSVEAWVGGKRAGWVNWRTMSQTSNDAAAARVGYIASVYTGPEFRRKRISSYLMSLAAEEMRREGRTEAWLMARVKNEPAVALYTSLGWRSRTIAWTFVPGESL
jgi:GNAT superfamily N-acetyltransferase